MKTDYNKLDYQQGNLLSLIDELEIINVDDELDDIIDALQEVNALINIALHDARRKK